MLNAQQRALAEQLFAQAVTLPPDQQALFLHEHCDDSEVCREVESLLQFAGSSAHDVVAAVKEIAGSLLAPDTPARLAEGTLLGRYRLQGVLGKGGMGEVYKARDTRLERTVAIKVLPAHISTNAESKERFEREA